MSICKLKLGFLDFFNDLSMFSSTHGPAHIKALCFGPLNEVLKPRKSDFPISPTLNRHNSLKISPN